MSNTSRGSRGVRGAGRLGGALLFLPFALAAQESAAPDAGVAIWEAPADPACRLELDMGSGDIDVQRGGDALRLLGDAGHWEVVSYKPDPAWKVILREREGVEPDASGSNRLRLDAPEHCAVQLLGGAGDIRVRGAHRAALKAETRTGDIVVWVEPDAGLDVRVATSGETTVDFSFDLEYRRHLEPAKLGSMRVGPGGVDLELSSRRGAVRVLKASRRFESGARTRY